MRRTAKSAIHFLTSFHISTIMEIMKPKPAKDAQQVAKYADMLSAMGTEPRLRIMQLLLSAHPEGLVVGDIRNELAIPTRRSRIIWKS